MKILVIHQYFLMEGMPGGSRFNELTKFWHDAGHDITVIAGNLDYASGSIPERYRGRWVVREKQGAIDVFRCHVPMSYNKSYLGRMWAFFGFTLSAATAVLKIDRPDVVIATSPPLITPFPAGLAALVRFRGTPWVFEIRDLWPESAITTGVLKANGMLTKLLFLIEKWACKLATRINVLTPAFRDDLVRRGLAPAEKIFFVPNGVDPDEFRPGPRANAFREEAGWGDKFVVMYAGAHGRANALMQLVDTAERLREHSDILIASVGNGPERQHLIDVCKTRGLTNIQFVGAQPKTRMPEVINACDVACAVLQNNPTFRTVYPNKVFDYMACGKPVLLAIDGVARDMVCSEAKGGIFVEPENPEAIAQGILQLYRDREGARMMGERGRAWVRAHHSRATLATRYLDVLSEMTRQADGGHSKVVPVTAAKPAGQLGSMRQDEIKVGLDRSV